MTVRAQKITRRRSDYLDGHDMAGPFMTGEADPGNGHVVAAPLVTCARGSRATG
jgi:hypothetical protein